MQAPDSHFSADKPEETSALGAVQGWGEMEVCLMTDTSKSTDRYLLRRRAEVCKNKMNRKWKALEQNGDKVRHSVLLVQMTPQWHVSKSTGIQIEEEKKVRSSCNKHIFGLLSNIFIDSGTNISCKYMSKLSPSGIAMKPLSNAI